MRSPNCEGRFMEVRVSGGRYFMGLSFALRKDTGAKVINVRSRDTHERVVTSTEELKLWV